MRGSLIDRFEEKIMPVPWTGCWLWMGGPRGLKPTIYDGTNSRLAHRVAYELYKGKIPTDMCVCHTCDIPECVNPIHLWLGTIKENAQDRERKGRGNQQNGERCGGSKLTAEQIIEIRSDPRSMQKIAKDYDIYASHVHRIKRRMSWKHLT